MGVAGASGQAQYPALREKHDHAHDERGASRCPDDEWEPESAGPPFWDKEPCGTGPAITQQLEPRSLKWFEQIDSHRYSIEPHIPSFAEFGRYKGARLLEIGVGAGADHLQWARAGAECHGVDLSPISLETTRIHLALHGLTSQLQSLDAENLTYPDDWFDVVYSWGVIHHAEHPSQSSTRCGGSLSLEANSSG